MKMSFLPIAQLPGVLIKDEQETVTVQTFYQVLVSSYPLRNLSDVKKTNRGDV